MAEAVDAKGADFVAAVNANEPIHYWYWSETMTQPEMRLVETVSMPLPA